MIQTNTVVIGGGPGGYVAAIRLAQLGIETTLVEQSSLGGTCLNVGCIPSKSLIHSAKCYYAAKHKYKRMGIEIPEVNLNFPALMTWKNQVVNKLSLGVQSLLKSNHVTQLTGTAAFTSPHQLTVTAGNDIELVEFKQCIIATGSHPTAIPILPVDQQYIVDSTGALDFKALPNSLAIIGGGYIGIELGMAYAKLGTKVTIIELASQILPSFDEDVVTIIHKQLKRYKITVLTQTQVVAHRIAENQVHLDLAGTTTHKTLTADCAFVSIGRQPHTQNLQLEQANLATDAQGFIPVDNQLRTAAPHIFAIGDVVGQPMLAHKATKEGEIAAEVIAGKNTTWDVRQVPAVVFTDPEIAQSGISESDAIKTNRQVTVSKFPFSAIGRSATANESEGFVKFISDAQTQEVLGVTIIGPQASDLISEAALGIEMGAQVEDFALTIHPHPTFGEIIMEAAKGNLGEAIHLPAIKGLSIN